MGKRIAMAAVLLVTAIAVAAGVAGAATVRVGTLVLQADGEFAPRALPKHRFAPIHFQGYGKIKETNGSIPPPLQHVEIEFDRDGRLTTAGLPICPPSKLEGATTAQARGRCGAAIVGTGHVSAAVTLAGLARVDLKAPLSLFNGPRRNGHPTIVGHVRAPFPLLETYVVVAPLERIHNRTFGYRTEFDVPPIAGGFGSLTGIDAKLGRRYRFHGNEMSYVSARCSNYVQQTRGSFSFADGTVIYGSVFKTCTPRP